MLEGVGLPYAVHRVDITAGVQFAPEFLAISSNYKIPALTDCDATGERRVVFESDAILIYLAERSGVLLTSHGHRHDEPLSCLFWSASGVGPALGRPPRHLAAPNRQLELDASGREVNRLMRGFGKRLNEGPFLAGEYSTADIAVFTSPQPTFPAIKTRLRAQVGDTLGVDRWLQTANAWAAVQRGLRASKSRVRQMAAQSTRPAC
jgi:GST-like protein